MNFFELLIFLSVTAIVGATIGVLLSLLAGGLIAKAATTGAFAGPVVAAFAVTIWVFLSKRRR